jgi:hypothetical protein
VYNIGNTTRGAELRHTQTGKAVSSIPLAMNRTGKDEEGKERGMAENVADDVQFLCRRGMEAEVSPRCRPPLGRCPKSKTNFGPRVTKSVFQNPSGGGMIVGHEHINACSH